MTLSFTVHEVGDVTDDAADGTCPNVGEIFNPLAEYVWWDRMVNPFADPSRGAIRPTTVDFDADGNFVFAQADFLQNLGGKNSLIGRSIKATTSNAMGVASFTRCCVIGRDKSPVPTTSATEYAHPHQHPRGGHKPARRAPTYG